MTHAKSDSGRLSTRAWRSDKLAEIKQYNRVDFDTSKQTDHTGWKTYEYLVEFIGAGVVAVGMNVVLGATVERFSDEVWLVRAESG